MQTLFAWQQLRNSDKHIAWEQFIDSVKETHGESSQATELEKLFKQQLNPSASGEQHNFPTEFLDLAEKTTAAYRLQASKDLKFLRSQMIKEVEGIHQTFLWVLGLFPALAEFESRFISRKKSLPDNRHPEVILGMQSIDLIRQAVHSLQVPSWNDHQDRLSHWYKKIREQLHSEDRQKESSMIEDEVTRLRLIFQTVLWKGDSFQNFFEEYDRGWVENKDIIKSLVNKTLKSITSEGLELAPLSYQWEDDKEFFTDIFDTTLKNEPWTEKLVAERAKNWETDRIAQVDMVLLKMAITEMINFPSIPVKVTINEYIELSKKYSTPKSKKFINGILDVLADHLTENGTIKKSGRGLIDNK